MAKNIDQLDNVVVIKNYNLFKMIWSIGLIVFGIHLLLVAVLMKLHKLMPRILYYLMIIAGVPYIIIHLMKIVFPLLIELSNVLNTILGLPMSLAELSLAVWLKAKGGKINTIIT